MKNNELLGDFQDRARKIMDDTANMGWGFQDGIEYIYEQYYQSTGNE